MPDSRPVTSNEAFGTSVIVPDSPEAVCRGVAHPRVSRAPLIWLNGEGSQSRAYETAPILRGSVRGTVSFVTL